jgi:hypothetical protein
MVHPRLRRPLLRLLLAVSPVFSALAASAADGVPFDGFPFHIPPTGTVPGTAPAALGLPARPADSPIVIRGDQFIRADTGEPIRFWGVNLSFAGAFPDHENADRIAARLASLGVNIVRFHHIDQRRFPGGLWHRDAPGASANPREDDIEHRVFDPESLDRLDYLVARLKAHGIYANLNLKVSRTFSTYDGPAFPAPAADEFTPRKGKGFDQFYTPAIEAQKTFARLLLTHRNPYTGSTYAAEPAVAQVEINNENGILWAWNYNLLDRLPAPYLAELSSRWNTWLRARYPDTAALRAAWADGSAAASSVLSPGAPASTDLLAGVAPELRTARRARATLLPPPARDTGDADADDTTALRLTVDEVPDAASWNVRCNYPLTLSPGATYLATLRLRANREEKIALRLRDPDNQNLAAPRTLNLETDWKRHTLTFAVPAGDHPADTLAALLSLEAGRPGLVLDIDAASFRLNLLAGLPSGQGIDPGDRPVAWVLRRDLPDRTPATVTDIMRFLRDTEVAYWREMHAYLRDELGVVAPIAGTAVGYSTPQIQAETGDFVDTHRYWGAPRFPRFDRSKPWTVEQKAMVAHPGSSTFERMAARRVFGRPFTVTEYNHPPSSDHHAEAFPLLALYGSAQDWDALFQFAYAHSPDAWEGDTLRGFFDTAPNPAHTVAALAASDIFRKRRVAPFSEAVAVHVPLERQLERQNNYAFPRLVEACAVFGGLPADAWLHRRVGLALHPGEQPASLPPAASGHHLVWDAAHAGSAHVRFVGDGAAGLVGFVAGRTLDLGWLRITPGTTSLDGFSVVMLNAVDGQPLGAPGRHLLTVVVRAANRHMGWNADRTGFGTAWGEGPALVETAPVDLAFLKPARVHALAPDGTRRVELAPAEGSGSAVRFRAGPEYRTLWYEISL